MRTTVHRLLLVGALLVPLLFCNSTLGAPPSLPTRALKVIATDNLTQKTGEVTLYNKTVAVIIGIDEYANLPFDKQLTYAVRDAKGVADVLQRQYRFDKIITLYNKEATRNRILDLLTEDLANELGEQDALFIFWAGHGNQENSREGELGYLIPYDGDIKKIRTNITMSEIRNTISKKIPAKHIFYVMDACYSGLLTETRSMSAAPRRDLAYLQDITKERVRQVLTAGSKNQEVLDGGANGHSVFTSRLIELLDKAGDFITANEIQSIIKEKVNGDARARNHKQTPAFGTLYGSGDFVFIPSLEKKMIDNFAEMEKLEDELKLFDAADLAATESEASNSKRIIEGKLKIEQSKQERLAAEQLRQDADVIERKRLLDAKTSDEQRLSALKTAAEERRKNSPSHSPDRFPTVQSAATEIDRLNLQIASIESKYQTELAQTRKTIGQRYATQLNVENTAQRDEFETEATFKLRKYKARVELTRSGNAELARLGTTALAAAETDPLREHIQELAARKYVIGVDDLVAKLGTYDAEAQQFSVSITSRNPLVDLAINGKVPLQLDQARAFKQQWTAGLIKPEAVVRSNGQTLELALVNDADNTRWIHAGGSFAISQLNQLDRNKNNARQIDKLEMLTIPAGSFNMGTNSGNSDESPAHTVRIERAFALGKTEVTQAQWKEIMGSNPSKFIHCGENCPITNVSWDDAQVFIQKLNAITHKNYRLPSEAEWAYACRGGKIQDYCGSDQAHSVAWFEENSGNSIHPVASKSANAYGLYDMSGNAWEWVEDSYHNSYTGAPSDGSVWRSNNPQRVLRGGSWYSISQGLLATRREVSDPGNRFERFGFRLARSLP